jgi:hypothetical protein
MATYSGYLMTGIPVNTYVDKLNVYSSTTSSGIYTLDDVLDYSYPTKVTMYEVDESKWYKVQFASSDDGYITPVSEATAGSSILKTAPVLEISSSNDGAAFATVQNVYDRSNMTSADVPESDVSYALTIARSFIDMRLSTISMDRYRCFPQTVQTRKYNALLKLIKDVEINYTLSLVYKYMADDKILQNVTSNKKRSSSVSVGQTSIAGIEDGESLETATYFDALSTRHASYAAELLNSLMPNYVPLRYSENGTGYDMSSHERIISYSNGQVSFDFSAGIILDRMEL